MLRDDAARPLPRVLISVLSFNDFESLRDTMTSLQSQTYTACELLIVDNGSSAAHRSALESDYASVPMIRSERNLGFGAGNNLALRYGLDRGFDYVIVCNDDIRLPPQAVERMVETLATVPDVGVAGAVELNYDGTEIVSCGGELQWYLHRIVWNRSRPRTRAAVIEAFAPQGSLVLFTAAALRRDVFFDESLMLYCEEIELGHRVRRAGLQVRICAEVEYRHRGGGNRFARGLNLVQAYCLARNRAVIARRYLGPVRYGIFLTCFGAEMAVKVMWRAVIAPRGVPHGFIPATLRGAYDGIAGRPDRNGERVMAANI